MKRRDKIGYRIDRLQTENIQLQTRHRTKQKKLYSWGSGTEEELKMRRIVNGYKVRVCGRKVLGDWWCLGRWSCL